VPTWAHRTLKGVHEVEEADAFPHAIPLSGRTLTNDACGLEANESTPCGLITDPERLVDG
jgi:hypothetical protein